MRSTPLIVLLLLAVAVPWYWPADDRSLVAGLPAWVAMAVLVSVCASVLIAWALRRPWPGETEADREEEDR